MNRKIMGMGIGMLGAALLLAGCGSDQKLEQSAGTADDRDQ
jgi:outer membrane murein-binding lipoprotein Lpp